MYCKHCHGPVEFDTDGNLWHITEDDAGSYIHAFTVGHMPRVEREITDEERAGKYDDTIEPLFQMQEQFELVKDMGKSCQTGLSAVK